MRELMPEFVEVVVVERIDDAPSEMDAVAARERVCAAASCLAVLVDPYRREVDVECSFGCTQDGGW